MIFFHHSFRLPKKTVSLKGMTSCSVSCEIVQLIIIIVRSGGNRSKREDVMDDARDERFGRDGEDCD